MNKSVMFVLMAILLFSSVIGTQQAQAETTVKLKHLGVMQLAAHDLFDVDRTLKIDFENGLLDLSTLFRNMRGDGSDYPDAQIKLGGEFRNAENVMIFTIASELGEKYVMEKNKPQVSAEQAKQIVLADYKILLEDAYLATFGVSLPKPSNGCVTMTENLALRTIHDLLPEFIDFGGSSTFIFNIPLLSKLSLTEREANSSPLDGDFDTAFKTLIMLPPPINKQLNLMVQDQTFGDLFNTDFSFDFFMSELVNESYDPNDIVMKHIQNLFSKGFGDGCFVGGKTIPLESTSLILAGAQSNAWLIPVVLSLVGIGLFVVSRKSP